MNLSRGQQARLNLARAIYKKADIYLLDDSLSALDTTVSRFIFNNCIRGFLKDKLCLIITHQQQYLRELDKVLYLKNGRLLMEGTFDELLQSELREEILRNQIDFDNENQVTIIPNKYEEIDEGDLTETTKLLDKKHVYHEEQKEGGIDADMYKIYFKSGSGIAYMLFVILLFFLATLFGSYFDIFVKNW